MSTFGCESAATARASCSKRRTRSESAASRSGRTLIATSRPSLGSRARYTSPIRAKPVTWRLAVDNVANRYYWSTVAPSNLTGANTGSLLAHLGSPRTVLAAVSVDF